jgi:hypothetical protein
MAHPGSNIKQPGWQEKIRGRKKVESNLPMALAKFCHNPASNRISSYKEKRQAVGYLTLFL